MANRKRVHEDIDTLDYPTKRRRILQLSEDKINARSTEKETSHRKYWMIGRIASYIERELWEECETGLESLSDYSVSDTDDDDSNSDEEDAGATQTDSDSEDSEDATAANVLEEYLHRDRSSSARQPVAETPMELDNRSDSVLNPDEVQHEVDTATNFLESYLWSNEPSECQLTTSQSESQSTDIPSEQQSEDIGTEPHSSDMLAEAMESLCHYLDY